MPLTLDPVSRASKWLKPKNKVKSWRDLLTEKSADALATKTRKWPSSNPEILGYEALHQRVRDEASKPSIGTPRCAENRSRESQSAATLPHAPFARNSRAEISSYPWNQRVVGHPRGCKKRSHPAPVVDQGQPKKWSSPNPKVKDQSSKATSLPQDFPNQNCSANSGRKSK